MLPRLLARLATTALAGIVALVAALVGAGHASAEVRVVTVTLAQLVRIAPTCPVAWSIVEGDPRLPAGISREVAIGTCLQRLTSVTRLSPTATTPPSPDTPVPPGPDEQPVAPFTVRLVRPTDPAAGVSPVPVPVPVPAHPAASPVTVTVTVEAAPARPAPAPARAAPAPARAAPARAAGPATAGRVTPERTAASASSVSGAGPVDPDATAGALPAGPAPVLAAPPPPRPVAVTGLPGTVSDPAAVASETTGDSGASRLALLVVGVVVLVAVAGLGLWAAPRRGRGLVERVSAALSSVRGRGVAPGEPEPGGPGDADAVRFVEKWLHAGGGHHPDLASPSPGGWTGAAPGRAVAPGAATTLGPRDRR